MSELITRFVTIKLYGEESNVEVQPDETVLLAAFRTGLDPPFSCQVGICGTCSARLVSGEVEMDEPEALTEEEIRNGIILTCQAHPASDNCYIDYDYQ